MSEILPVNKSVTFYTPLKKIVRTGTIGEGSCLVHSILRAIDKQYIKLTTVPTLTKISQYTAHPAK